ncbi:hypothetical protein NDA00_06790 [Funiculus sociatus GB2-M2]|uniref:hypothetical protein n=1 Tax=Cyanophyceae TaxID=3028117 RepID=UPI001F5534F5|nr:hypothetical protein [Trichocoleus sp. FACHB-90]
MPLHLKASGQAGIEGNPIFDPVGTNEYIKSALVKLGWSKILIPAEYDFLGKDIDFGKTGAIVEVQFSHYAFLPNNTLRSELFFKAGTHFVGQPTKAVVIVTKSQMFPASNSSLYYEQAVNQLTALAQNKVFDVPIRLVGLFEAKNENIPVKWTVYEKPTSRKIVAQGYRQCLINSGLSARRRCVLQLR